MKRFNRRSFVKLACFSAATGLLSACALPPAPRVVQVVVTSTPPPPAEGAKTILRVGTGDSGEGLTPHFKIIETIRGGQSGHPGAPGAGRQRRLLRPHPHTDRSRRPAGHCCRSATTPCRCLSARAHLPTSTRSSPAATVPGHQHLSAGRAGPGQWMAGNTCFPRTSHHWRSTTTRSCSTKPACPIPRTAGHGKTS